MDKGLKVGKVLGIPIIIDTSWIVIFFLITWAFWGQFRVLAPATPSPADWGAALIASGLFFASVLIHELSHSVVALRRGIEVKRIRLFIFGGVSEISEEASTPQDEFAITIAGPLASFVLGGIFFAVTLFMPAGRDAWSAVVGLILHGASDKVPAGEQAALLTALVPATLASINLALGAFNLLPGFPLDGGRVLRSILWRVTGNSDRATRAAAAGGRLIAFLMISFGFFDLLFLGDVGGLWYVFLGWFLMQAANQTLLQAEIQAGLRGVSAGQVMTPTPIALPGDITLQEAFDGFIMQHNYSVFPVVVDGRVRGTISLNHLREVPRHLWSTTTVASVMRPLEPEDTVSDEAPVDTLLPRLTGGGGRVVVVRDGRLVGIISPSDITSWLQRQKL